MKKFVAVVLLVTALFIGIYTAWANWRPVPVVVQATPVSGTPTLALPTIVPASVNKDGIPEKLGALALVNSELGKDALNEFAQLHGQGFDLVNGYRAEYASGESKATLWVGQAKDATAAQSMVQTMADKIAAGNPMFTDLQQLSISGRTIYEVKGQGQYHFFYATNDKIVWVATDPANAVEALHSIWGAVK